METEALIVCIVDSDEATRKLIQKNLGEEFQDEDMIILSYKSGEAFEQADIHPHIMLVDYSLNKERAGTINGYELMERVKRSHRDTDLVMFTGEDSAAMAVQGLKLGVHDYLVKNEYMVHKLRTSVQQCVKLWTLRQRIKKEHRVKQLRACATVLFLAMAFCLYYFSQYGI